MGMFVKCRKCGSSNRSRDSLCYNCREDLHAAPEPTSTDLEIQQFERAGVSLAFYGKLFVFFLALIICRPYFTQSQVYGIFEYAIFPFHEAGHYFLMPFAPHTLMVAGGTIVQLALPLSFVLYFAWRRQEFFSACVPFLWFFGSMQQMAVYMKDARFLLLPMFAVDPSEGHDWNYLFGKMKLLHRSVEIGEFFQGLAKVGIALTLIGMLALLALDPGRPWQKSTSSESQEA